MRKLIPRSQFHDYTKSTGNSVKDREHREYRVDKNIDTALLSRAEQAWDNLRSFRATRRRHINYVFGDQWAEKIKDEHGHTITERERMIRKDGQPPLQNNHLIKIERTLCGVYAKSGSMPVCFAREQDADAKSEMMTRALQTNWERNSEKEILTSSMSEMIIGGLPVLVEEWASEDGVEDSYTYVVNPDYFFYESKSGDPRMWDVSLVGEIRDYTFNELVAEFARSDYDISQLRAIYGHVLDSVDTRDQNSRLEYQSFNDPPANNLCRTYRVWTQETKVRYRCIDVTDVEPMYRIEKEDLPAIKAINAGRIETFRKMYLSQGMDEMRAKMLAEQEAPLIEYERINDLFWQLTILTPSGHVLDSYESPYEHRSHPYVFRPHQLVSGRIYPFIGVVIDQQRYINRLITLKDMYIRSMTKGLKLIPKTVLGGLSPDQFARQSVELNGFIFYEPDRNNSHAIPQVISQSASDLGVEEMIALQVGWMNDITNVSGALQGKAPSSGTAYSRYLLETNNATTSIASLLTKFSAFECDLARKKMKVIHQFYTAGRSIAGSKTNGYMEYATYDPVLVEDVDFDVSIKESAESPVSRMMINEVIQQMWASGAISAEQMLEFSYLPGSQQVLQSLRAARQKQEQAMAQQQQMQQGQAQAVNPQQAGIDAQAAQASVQEQMQQLARNANPQTVRQVQGILSANN